MSFIDNGLSAADVAAVMNGNNNSGFGFGGDGAWWLIILFLFAMNGNGWGFGGNGGQSGMQRGFDQQAVMGSLNGISTAIANGFSNAEVSAANRQMAGMQQAFAAQTAVDSRLDSLAMSLQQCCCDNRAATADLKYTVANDGATTRNAITTANQQILDKLCQLELDGVRQNYENRIAGLQTEMANLRSQLTAANNAASQTAQTSRILADNAAQTMALEQYLNPTPVPAYVVQNPNCCANNFNSCGCMQ